MRNKWLALMVCALGVIAAEKNRDWQMGQVVAPTVEQATAAPGAGAQIHTIASSGKNYVVRGFLGNGDDTLTVGARVRFAVEGKTMYISLAGEEYRLYVLGEKVAAPEDPKLALLPNPAANKPAAAGDAPLDNDAVVKMIAGGLKEDTVIRVIETRPGKYSLGPDALVALRAAGVPQSVVAAMTVRMKQP
jgi:hypothetical protein